MVKRQGGEKGLERTPPILGDNIEDLRKLNLNSDEWSWITNFILGMPSIAKMEPTIQVRLRLHVLVFLYLNLLPQVLPDIIPQYIATTTPIFKSEWCINKSKSFSQQNKDDLWKLFHNLRREAMDKQVLTREQTTLGKSGKIYIKTLMNLYLHTIVSHYAAFILQTFGILSLI